MSFPSPIADRRGVTLLELVVTMGLMTMLITLTVPRVNNRPNLTKYVLPLRKDPFCTLQYESVPSERELPWNVFAVGADQLVQNALCWRRSRVSICYQISEYELGSCRMLVQRKIADCRSQRMKRFANDRLSRIGPEDQKREISSLLSCVGPDFTGRNKPQLLAKNKSCRAVESYLSTGQSDWHDAACLPLMPWD